MSEELDDIMDLFRRIPLLDDQGLQVFLNALLAVIADCSCLAVLMKYPSLGKLVFCVPHPLLCRLSHIHNPPRFDHFFDQRATSLSASAFSTPMRRSMGLSWLSWTISRSISLDCVAVPRAREPKRMMLSGS